jgi:hypothetical protein
MKAVNKEEAEEKKLQQNFEGEGIDDLKDSLNCSSFQDSLYSSQN